MADFELDLQPGLCHSGPTIFYAQFYAHKPGSEPARSRPVLIGGSRMRPHHLLERALHEFKRESRGLYIGAVSIQGVCHRKLHDQRPRLERVVDYVHGGADMRRLAVADGEYEPVTDGFGAVRLNMPTLAVIPRTAFFATTEQERLSHPVTEVAVVGDQRSHMYVALRGLEEFIQLR